MVTPVFAADLGSSVARSNKEAAKSFEKPLRCAIIPAKYKQREGAGIKIKQLDWGLRRPLSLNLAHNSGSLFEMSFLNYRLGF